VVLSRATVVTVVLAVALGGSAVGWATPAARSVAPLPGSSFEGANGEQVATPPNVDWRELQAVGVVQHNPDPNAADTAFTGGSKENEPGAWGLTTEANGVNPPDANILDAWSSVDQPDARTFLYLAFRRQAGTGSSFVVFELNRDARLWNNGQATVPCRRTGDVLVGLETTGNTVSVVLQRWTTSTADPTTDCARTGSFSDATSIPADAVQGAMNAASIDNYLPGTAPVPGTIPAGQFGEVSLDLARLLHVGFGEPCMAFSSIWMHTRSSPSHTSNMQDYVAPQPLAVRTCTASGRKFFDSNANGRHDPGERGIPRFVIWADYNNDGMRQSDEPYSVTDRRGRYVIYDIRPRDGTYTLRETLLTRKIRNSPTNWICSYPNASTPGGSGNHPGGQFRCGWGPIDVATTPNAKRRDFGNWYPAQLTVEKQLAPTDDPGRFDLIVNDHVVVPAAGDGASRTLLLPPGSYTVSEQPTPSTNGADYASSVACRQNVNRRRKRRSSVSFTVQLSAGQRASCVFRNTLIVPDVPVPEIAIEKVGPATATFGDTLHYTLYVTNPGGVPFPESDVKVTDPVCDAAPTLVSKHGPSGNDSSPATLDPGDTWVYTCSHATTPAGTPCTPTSVDNTGDVTGTAAGTVVRDDDTISTILLCPDEPVPIEPLPPEAGPTPPGPVEPSGPRPPAAGDAGRAGLILREVGKCIRSQHPRLYIAGTRIARVRLAVDGVPRKELTFRPLQRRLTRRVLVPPGRSRITAHITFQRGSGTPAVTLAAIVNVCAPTAPPPPPAVTG
jgi:uncharacterized repeat protein (TIGR01451 family)